MLSPHSSLLRGSGRLRQHSSRMLVRQNLIFTSRRGIIVNRIIIKGVNRQRRRKLPKRIVSDARVQQRGLLPRFHNGAFVCRVRRAILLKHDGLPGRFARGVVLHDPLVAPGVVVAPRLGIEVEGAVVEGRDGEVLDKVDAFVARVGVGSVAYGGRHPPFVAQGDHVLRIQRFDVGADAGCPVGDDGGRAAGAARLVAQFPGEYGGGAFVAVDD